jgi:exodeoxyribonuclease III
VVKIATFNVNSIAVRLPILLAWLEQAKPDIVCLQEIKCPAADFPLLELRGLGYHVEAVGQRSYNGVALLSRAAMRDVVRALPGDPGDDQARYIEATIGDLRVASIYLPNGNPLGTEKFTYKLAWMRRLKAHTETLLESEVPFVLAGDYNVAPTDDDVFDPHAMGDDAICQPESRARFRALLNLGLTDAFRAIHSEAHRYSFWDYQAGRWYRDEGLRIDHLLLSPQAADRLVAADIDKSPRGKDKASDHTPVWCEIAGLANG